MGFSFIPLSSSATSGNSSHFWFGGKEIYKNFIPDGFVWLVRNGPASMVMVEFSWLFLT
jgi:hypothetical protein